MVLDQTPSYRDPSCVELRYLNTPEGDPATENTITDPSHWAVYIVEDTILVDEHTGEVVDRRDVDWHCRFSASSQPEDGKRHPNSVTEKDVWVADWYCTDDAAAGLALCETLAMRVAPIARQNATSDNGAETGGVAPDHEAREAARQAGAAPGTPQVHRAQQTWRSSPTGPAQLHHRKLLARKTPPKGGARFVAQCRTRDIRLEELHGTGIAAELLGLGDSAAMHTQARGVVANADGRAQVITLALVLGALQARTGKNA